MSELTYDILDHGFLINPYPYYDTQREIEPICFSDRWGMWVFTRYEDITNLLRDRRLGRSILHVMTREELGWPPAREDLEPFYDLHRHRLMDLEPPDHTRIRNLVQKVFTPQVVENLRPRIQSLTDRLLDRAAEMERIDLLADFAVPLPVAVIAELLGIPEADRTPLHPWSQNIVTMYELNPSPDDERNAVRAVVEFSSYLRELANFYRTHPADNLLSNLVRVEDQGERLTEKELIGTCVLLLNAGHEATVNVIGNGMYAFFCNPDQLELLRQNPGYLKNAIEEMLRYDTPLQFFKRWAMEDVSYQGYLFKKGTLMGFAYGSANRDPEHFSRPHAFDIQRPEKGHMSFGLGTHFCLGAPLARLELAIAIKSLLERFPGMTIDTDEVEWRLTYIIRGLRKLPVRLT